MHILSIATFGILGIFSRYFLDLIFSKHFPNFPIGILSINVLGSLIAGLIYVLGNEKGFFSSTMTLSLLVGFCGGFTTFSAYTLQAILLMEKNNFILASTYFFISPLLGVVGAYLGITLARVI